MVGTYVDANTLVYAFGLADHPRREAARRALQQAAAEGAILTSVLTVDEFLWARWRESERDTATQDTQFLLDSPVLRFVPVDLDHLREANRIVAGTGLRPRDAIHVAVAIEQGCARILSDDPDFDPVGALERVSPV